MTLCTTRYKVYCTYCRYCSRKGLLCLAKKEDTFIDTGFDNWKKAHERFAQHTQSSLHKEAIFKIEQLKHDSVHTLLCRHAIADQKLHREMLLNQLSTLRYLLRQGMAIRGHNDVDSNLTQLLLLRSHEIPQLKSWLREKKYCSPEIQNEQISLMGLNVLRGLLSEIRNAEFYSIIADEASDVSHKEQLVVCIRWVDNDFEIHEDPIELINVPKTDANTLTTCIKDCLVRCCLPISQCRGQAYDGASNMSGHLSGVAAQIQTDTPSALYVHCLAHCTNLCLQTVGRQCIPIRDALDLVIGVADLIRYSPKRSSLFEALQSQLAPGSPSLKPLCPTRWTVRTCALHSILCNYSVLRETLQQVNAECHDDYGRTAGGYLAQMDKFSTYLGLKVSHLIFAGTEQLSITLQGKDTTVQDAATAADLAVCYLERQRSDEKFHSFYQDVLKSSKDLTAPPCLPRYRRPPKRLDEASLTSHEFTSPESYFRQQYFEVLDLLASELKRRFQQKRGMPVVAAIEKLLLDAANATLVSTDLPEELQLYKDDLDLSRLKCQLPMLPDVIRVRNQKLQNNVPIPKVTNVRTLYSVMTEISLSTEMFSEVIRLIKLFYTIPVTTSSAERTFSALRRLKTYLRTTMSQPRLNHAMTLYVHKERTDKINLAEIANSFVVMNERRRNYFGHVCFFFNSIIVCCILF